jgi:hypothetical protein
MTTTTTAPQTLDEAKAAVIAARNTHEVLRNTAALPGDTKITAAKIAEAADRIVFAELRLAAAVAADEAAQAVKHAAAVEQLRADIAAFDTSVVDGARAFYAATVEALRRLAGAVESHEAARDKLRGRAGALGLAAHEVPIESLKPRVYDFAQLAVQDAAGRLRGAHALSSDADAAAASESAAKAGAKFSTVRVRRDLQNARANANALRQQSATYAKIGEDAAADELLSRAAKADADVVRLTAEMARLDELAQ